MQYADSARFDLDNRLNMLISGILESNADVVTIQDMVCDRMKKPARVRLGHIYHVINSDSYDRVLTQKLILMTLLALLFVAVLVHITAASFMFCAGGLTLALLPICLSVADWSVCVAWGRDQRGRDTMGLTTLLKRSRFMQPQPPTLLPGCMMVRSRIVDTDVTIVNVDVQNNTAYDTLRQISCITGSSIVLIAGHSACTPRVARKILGSAFDDEPNGNSFGTLCEGNRLVRVDHVFAKNARVRTCLPAFDGITEPMISSHFGVCCVVRYGHAQP